MSGCTEFSISKPATSADKAFRFSDYLAPRHWPTWAGLSAIWLFSRLSFDRQLGAGRQLGKLLYHALPSRRRVCLTNLQIAFPDLDEASRIRLAKRVYMHLGYSIAEMASLWFRPIREFDDRVTLIGREHVEAAWADGRGVILLQAHFSTLELCGSWLARELGERCCAVYDNPKNPLYAALLRAKRARYVNTLIENTDIRKMVRRLRKGDLVWYSPDQAVKRRNGGIDTLFFGRQVLTTPGTSRIASMTNAVILPYCAVRDRSRPGHYILTIRPPVDGLASGDAAADTNAMNQLFEEQIRRFPAQYFWVHKRFKRADKSQPDPYA
ncbi:lysophospholipid acyltransferase family protein [Granulosicoccaceae sp. 1_MG-2023]|nr:lysophospholipid acyltransferase family protein [Granulosicoccaceae sp. 1_MG-2023]